MRIAISSTGYPHVELCCYLAAYSHINFFLGGAFLVGYLALNDARDKDIDTVLGGLRIAHVRFRICVGGDGKHNPKHCDTNIS